MASASIMRLLLCVDEERLCELVAGRSIRTSRRNDRGFLDNDEQISELFSLAVSSHEGAPMNLLGTVLVREFAEILP